MQIVVNVAEPVKVKLKLDKDVLAAAVNPQPAELDVAVIEPR